MEEKQLEECQSYELPYEFWENLDFLIKSLSSYHNKELEIVDSWRKSSCDINWEHDPRYEYLGHVDDPIEDSMFYVMSWIQPILLEMREIRKMRKEASKLV